MACQKVLATIAEWERWLDENKQALRDAFQKGDRKVRLRGSAKVRRDVRPRANHRLGLGLGGR